eukprot:6201564-Prymnesium_polylepis.1
MSVDINDLIRAIFKELHEGGEYAKVSAATVCRPPSLPPAARHLLQPVTCVIPDLEAASHTRFVRPCLLPCAPAHISHCGHITSRPALISRAQGKGREFWAWVRKHYPK